MDPRGFNNGANNARGNFSGSFGNGGEPPYGHGAYGFPAHGHYPPGPPMGYYAPAPLRQHLGVEPGQKAFHPGPPPPLHPHKYYGSAMPFPQPPRHDHHMTGPAPPPPPSQDSAARSFTLNAEAKPFEPKAKKPEEEQKKRKKKKTKQRPSMAQRERRCKNTGCPSFWNHPTSLCVEKTGGPAVWGRH